LQFLSGDISIPDRIFDTITYTIEPIMYTFTLADRPTLYFNITDDNSSLEWFNISVYFYNTTLMSWVLMYTDNDTTSSGGSLSYALPNETGKYSFACKFKKDGFDEHSFSSKIYILYQNVIDEAVHLIPDEVFLAITIFLMMACMGLLVKFGAGAMCGLGGIAVMGAMFALRPELSFSGVSVWFIFLATVIVYLVIMFLLRGRI
jgi:hypothetical protein